MRARIDGRADIFFAVRVGAHSASPSLIETFEKTIPLMIPAFILSAFRRIFFV
jgi:hypothetical protein